MNLTEIINLPSRELASLVLEKVLGYQHLTGEDVPEKWHHRSCKLADQEIWYKNDSNYYCVACSELPDYTYSLQADYDMLQHMCKEIFHVREQFFSMLNKIVHTRAPNCKIVNWPHALIFYRVGDYARAALATKMIENGELEDLPESPVAFYERVSKRPDVNAILEGLGND